MLIIPSKNGTFKDNSWQAVLLSSNTSRGQKTPLKISKKLATEVLAWKYFSKWLLWKTWQSFQKKNVSDVHVAKVVDLYKKKFCHCIKNFRIWSFPGPNVWKYGREKPQMRSFFTQCVVSVYYEFFKGFYSDCQENLQTTIFCWARFVWFWHLLVFTSFNPFEMYQIGQAKNWPFRYILH